MGGGGGNCSRRCSLYFSLKFKFDNPFSGAVFIRMIITHVTVCGGGGGGRGCSKGCCLDFSLKVMLFFTTLL